MPRHRKQLTLVPEYELEEGDTSPTLQRDATAMFGSPSRTEDNVPEPEEVLSPVQHLPESPDKYGFGYGENPFENGAAGRQERVDST